MIAFPVVLRVRGIVPFNCPAYKKAGSVALLSGDGYLPLPGCARHSSLLWCCVICVHLRRYVVGYLLCVDFPSVHTSDDEMKPREAPTEAFHPGSSLNFMALHLLDCAIKWTINVKQVVIEMTTWLHYLVHHNNN